MGYKVVCFSGRRNQTKLAFINNINTAVTIGDDGVGNVDGATVKDARTIGSFIPGDSGIAEGEGASIVKNATTEGPAGIPRDGEGSGIPDAAAVGSDIVRDSGIGNVEGGAELGEDATAVSITTTASRRIARNCRIRDRKGAASVDASTVVSGIPGDGGITEHKGASVPDTATEAAAAGCSISGDSGIGNAEDARVIKSAAIVRGSRTRNSYARNSKVATRSDVENSKIAAGITIITTDGKRKSPWARDG